MENEKRFAVLIDADNVSDKYIKTILDEISNEGVASIRRIYGDWTNSQLNSWKNVLLDNSVTPVQQYAYTTGKNATDSAMIIDAMDILYTGNAEGFCIVSSDSDFTRLATRLREAGMMVVGMGEQKTPKPFIAACSKFKYLDVLSNPEPTVEPAPQGGAAKKRTTKAERKTDDIKSEIRTIVEENSDEDGWAHLGMLGTMLLKRSPDFDVRNYGYSKLTKLINALGDFEIRGVQSGDSGAKVVYIRDKTK